MTTTRRRDLPRRVLVANRGEIACRIIRTAERLGVESVAVYSEADAGALHTRLATTALPIGPPPAESSYRDLSRILDAAARGEVDALHPGYGFLSESPELAAACEDAGLAFIGPTPEQIRCFGIKHRARALARDAGVPVCAGSEPVASAGEAVAAAAALPFPLLLKATAGGGGMGMRLCRSADDVRDGFEAASRQAAAYFGEGGVFLEHFVEHARHVEVQVFGDGQGRVESLGVRDCSLQRRCQKVLEESATPRLDPALCAELEDAARRLAHSVAYRSAGTVEFVVDIDADGRRFYFLEMNTRLQVEHTVTELVTGVDLVEWMLRLAGDPDWALPEPPPPRGHAAEIRVYAEDPLRGFQPCTGTVTEAVLPEPLPGRTRVDGWVERGSDVSAFYDPLLVKLVAHGRDRDDALRGLAELLRETRIGGIQTNLDYARALLDWPCFREDRHHTRSLEEFDPRPRGVSVLDGGTLTTVQDHPGRTGYWSVGVPPSGPFDALSLQVANRIVGNEAGTAALEVTLRGPRLEIHRDVLLCVAGAATTVHLDGVPVPLHEAVAAKARSVLTVGEVTGPGARCYVAFRGGLDVPAYLGSCSTFTLGGFGGHGGRALAPGDVLPLGDSQTVPDPPLAGGAGAALAAPIVAAPDAWELRVVRGPHANPEFLTDAWAERFYAGRFEVHHQSARTGIRLLGGEPEWARRDGGEAGLHPSNIHDTAYCVGSVDFTGDMPVILGPDGPSLGGFVCPAVVVTADLWKLGQLTAGAFVRFVPVSPEEADRLAAAQEAVLARRDPGAAPWAEPARPAGPATAIAATARAGCVSARRPPDTDAKRDVAADAHPGLEIRRSGDRALLVEYGPMVLDLGLRLRVQLLHEALRDAAGGGALPGLGELTPGIRSLQVQYDPTRIPRRDLVAAIEALDDALPSPRDTTRPTRTVHLPLSWDDPQAREAMRRYGEVVRDDAPWCPDNIEFIRRINGLDSVEAVRRIVFDARYLVLGLGDVYLGAPVATPIDPRHRLVTTKYNPARTWTPENAVGIGGAYLCVYGMEGPGGYQLFGRTIPVWNTWERWRDGTSDAPWLLRFFDQIRFHRVSAEELLDLRRDLRAGLYAPRIEEGTFRLDAHRRAQADVAHEVAAFRHTQREAFEAERRRWVTSGELASAARAEQSLHAAPPAPEIPDLPAGARVVRAPLGAQVLRVNVEEGAEVAEGDALAILTAMKMETAVPTPVAGRVARVLCKPGQLVSPGSPLAIVQRRD